MSQTAGNKRLQILKEQFGITADENQYVIALAGNPNVGKSSIFNALTGLRQHTGNWPGKTVDNAQGTFAYCDCSFLLVDLPGTYSILAHTVEEQVARDFICFGRPDIALVVLDATCLERNLNLALQVMEVTSNVIVCVNLIDEARKKNIQVNTSILERELGVPVVITSARNGEGLDKLVNTIYQVASGKRTTSPRQVEYSTAVEAALQELLPDVELLLEDTINLRWVALRLLDCDKNFIDNIFSNMYGCRNAKEAVVI